MQWKLAMKKGIGFAIFRQLAIEPATQSEVQWLTRSRPTCHAYWGEGRRHRSDQASAERGPTDSGSRDATAGPGEHAAGQLQHRRCLARRAAGGHRPGRQRWGVPRGAGDGLAADDRHDRGPACQIVQAALTSPAVAASEQV
jgi:hypothetical protein